MDNRNFVAAFNKICDKQDLLKYAFNVDTEFNILPNDACKSFNMKCPCCFVKVILCLSVNGLWFFKHLINSESCDYYGTRWSKLRLSSYDIQRKKELIHDEAIDKMVNYLNSGKEITINKRCKWHYGDCGMLYPYEIKLEDGDSAVKEKCINDTLKRADIAILDNQGNIKEIIEIYCTNKTLEENRPSDIRWCELNAFDVLENIIENKDDYTCLREWCCKNCELENLRRQEERDRQFRENQRLLEERLAREEQERKERLAREEKERKRKLELSKQERRREQHRRYIEEQERLAREEKERNERLAREEQERKERLAREEQERKERLAREEQERQEKERLELLHKEKYDNLMKIENMILKKNPIIWEVLGKYYEVISYDDDNKIVKLKDVIDGKIFYKRGKDLSRQKHSKKRGISKYDFVPIYKD